MTNQDKELEEILNAFAVECIKCTEDDYKSKMTIPQATMKLLAWRDKSVNEAREIIACPVCLGIGTVASDFYPIDSVTGTGFGRQQCRTCKGETVVDAAHLNKKGNSND